MRAVFSVSIAILALMMSVIYPACNGQEGCLSVTRALLPCVGYIVNGGQVPAICCDGVKKVNAMAKTTPDRQAACLCIQTAIATIKPLPSSLANLPRICGVNLRVPISSTIDCSSL